MAAQVAAKYGETYQSRFACKPAMACLDILAHTIAAPVLLGSASVSD
jgi:hypothetical protein